MAKKLKETRIFQLFKSFIFFYPKNYFKKGFLNIQTLFLAY